MKERRKNIIKDYFLIKKLAKDVQIRFYKWLLADEHAQEKENLLYEEWKKSSSEPLINPEKVDLKRNHRSSWWIAASVALLLSVASTYFLTTRTNNEKYITLTAKKSQKLILPDSSVVWMHPGTTIEYKEKFEDDRLVKLNGDAIFEVKKQNGKRFRVLSSQLVIDVKGTCFNVERSALHDIVTLYNGKVDLICYGNQKLTMSPNDVVMVGRKTHSIHNKRISPIHWKDGKYIFKDVPLKEIVKTVNHLYGSHLIISQGINPEARFTGSLKYDDTVFDFIKRLKVIQEVKIRHDGDDIIMYK